MGLFDFLSKSKTPTSGRRYAFDELQEAAKVNRDYYVMTALSACIATFGLYLNSVAVIIGAMLIAPLMSPILACGLAIAHGDVGFLKRAVQTTVVGTGVALACAAVLTALVPRMPLGGEILARIHPNVFDMAVALISGAAGAYAFSSRALSPMLPGVAIAAALIPPLATAGIGFSTGRRDIFFGASLLFATNFVAIAVGAALTFLGLGFFPKQREKTRGYRLRTFVVAAILLAALLAPLVYFTVSNLTAARRQENLNAAVSLYLPASEGYAVREASARPVDGRTVVTIIVMGEREPLPDRINLIKHELRTVFHNDIIMELLFVPYKKMGN